MDAIDTIVSSIGSNAGISLRNSNYKQHKWTSWQVADHRCYSNSDLFFNALSQPMGQHTPNKISLGGFYQSSVR